MPSLPTSALGRRTRRRVGVEIEFGGLDTATTARILRDRLGGAIEATGPHAATVTGTTLGDIPVALDWSWVHKRGDDGGVVDLTKEVLADLGRDLVPTEIATPPIEAGRIGELDAVVRDLAAAGAKGTRAGLLNGFGLHLNPELWDDDLNADTLCDVLRAYLLLSPDLRGAIDVDLTRALLPFVAAFGDDYAGHVLRADYRPDLAGLIDDYIAFNPTRNRELDLLPVFAHLDEDRVRRRLGDEKNSSRPTFHWRLPNADLESPDWSISGEWDRWLTVEDLALDRDALTGRAEAWMATHGHKRTAPA